MYLVFNSESLANAMEFATDDVYFVNLYPIRIPPNILNTCCQNRPPVIDLPRHQGLVPRGTHSG